MKVEMSNPFSLMVRDITFSVIPHTDSFYLVMLIKGEQVTMRQVAPSVISNQMEDMLNEYCAAQALKVIFEPSDS